MIHFRFVFLTEFATNSNTRMNDRLLGPCFKTGLLTPFLASPSFPLLSVIVNETIVKQDATNNQVNCAQDKSVTQSTSHHGVKHNLVKDHVPVS